MKKFLSCFFAFLLCVISVSSAFSVSAADQTQIDISVTGSQNRAFAHEVFIAVNQERAKAGLPALKEDASLYTSAELRSAELSILFSHQRPDGTVCFTAMTQNHMASGENIAFNHRTPEEAMTAWMNSEGHRANILSDKFKTIGIACFTVNGTSYWVQMFGTNFSGAYTENADANRTVSVTADLQQIETTFKTQPPEDKEYKAGEKIDAALLLQNSAIKGIFTPVKIPSMVWKSSNSAVASIADGRIVCNKTGSAVVTAWLGNTKVAEIQLNLKVAQAPVEDTVYVLQEPNTTVADLAGEFSDAITVKDANGKVLDQKALVGTGCILSHGGKEQTVILKGDVNGDGKINATDYRVLRMTLIGATQLSEAGIRAALLSGGKTVSARDYLVLRQYLFGTVTING